VAPEVLIQRTFAKSRSLDYWESGMDLGLSRDMFDSFIRYQRLMAEKFQYLQKIYNFTIVDGNRSVGDVTQELRQKTESVLAG
jgi:dTMP kinase